MLHDDTHAAPAEEEVVQPLWREEFAPGSADEALGAFSRRAFLKLTAAAAALAGAAGSLGGCTKPQPPEKIVPYVLSPEGLLPGLPLFYASALPVDGWARGVVVEQHEGRPTKIEGNPDHPSSLGGTDIFMQASILQLYDPDRARTVTRMNNPDSWSNLLEELRTFLARHPTPRVRLLTPTLTSPSLAAQIEALRKAFPGLRWHRHDGVGMNNRTAGLATAAGRKDLTAVYDFTKVRRVVSLDAHFLADEPGSVRYAREFIQQRRLLFKAFGPHQTHRAPDAARPASTPSPDDMLRLYMAESTLTFTGAMADHRLAAKAGDIPHIAAQLARALTANTPATGPHAGWINAAAADLRSAGAAALVLAGENQPPSVHALAHALNAHLQSAGVRYVQRVDFLDAQNPDDSLAALTQDISSGQVDLLLLVDTNPVYTAPADIPIAAALESLARRNGLAIDLGLYADETAGLCRWHVPLSHPLEAWGDVRGHDGTAAIIQPLIQPLWASKSPLEFLAAITALAGGSAADLYADGFDLLRRHWFAAWQGSAGEKEMRWRKALKDGLLPDTAAAEVPNLADTFRTALDPALAAIDKLPPAPALELNFRPDPSLGDGAWANHPWLQELPKPLTRITWDNVLLVSPATARALKLSEDPDHQSRQVQNAAAVTVGGTTLNIPYWVQPGQPDDTLTVHLGGGRTRGGEIQANVGVNVNPLRRRDALWSTGAAVAISRVKHTIACTQSTQLQAEREIVKSRDLSALKNASGLHAPDLYGTQTDKDGKTVHLSLYDEPRYTGYKWGMVIDLTACIGCNACVIACQAENNIPCVGKEQVLKSREMHWLRIDAYYGEKDTGSLNAAEAADKIHFQPMLCQHCENAPCELVCPVEATSHSDEGLNEMTYNRCVGTRYCSNNCPYKVRRFNFLQYNDHDQPTLSMQKNPNVTVRSRGVMEKCTYCVQRLNAHRIDAKRDWAKNDRAGKPTEMRDTPQDPWAPPQPLPRISVMTACQQGCPTEAIIFGDLNDKDTYASVLKREQPFAAVSYGVLTELNTQPRTSYLERLTNKNPALPHAAETRAAATPPAPPGGRQ